MNRSQQAAFVRELTEAVSKGVVADILEGKTPDSWSGIELRALLAERFERAKTGRECDQTFWREYHNEVLVRNL